MVGLITDKNRHHIKYLDDLSNEVTFWMAELVMNVFNGFSESIGVKDPDKLAAKPPLKKAREHEECGCGMFHAGSIIPDDIMLKGFLTGMKSFGRKLRGFFGRKIDPVNVPFRPGGRGILYRKGKPVTLDQWNRFDREVMEYLRPYLDTAAQEMAVKGIVLAMASAEAEAQGKASSAYGKKSYEQIEKERFQGYVPDDMASVDHRYRVAAGIREAIARAEMRAADYVQRVGDDVRSAIRQQVVRANRLDLPEKDLASNLYWMKDDVPEMKKHTAQSLIRDWHRVAKTEMAYIHEVGKMGANEAQAREGVAVYYVFTGPTKCPVCQRFHGSIVRHIALDQIRSEDDDRLSSMGIKDPYTDTAVWQGKNNVGFRQAQWRICTPVHPWCDDTLTRIYPDAQVYDEKERRIKTRDSGELYDEIATQRTRDFFADIDTEMARAQLAREKMLLERKVAHR